MKFRSIGFGILLCTAPLAVAHAQASPGACPGLDDTGNRMPLSAGEVPSEAIGLPASVPVPADLALSAKGIIGRLESGGSDPYRNVGGIDGISLGYLQWNHGTGSLYDTFFAGLDASAIEGAPPRLRGDLRILKARAARIATNAEAEAVIASWTIGRPTDPLVGRVRGSVRQDLSTWLGTDVLRAHQERLIDFTMQSSYRLARAWTIAEDPTGSTPVDSRTLAYFFDLEVFNNGRAGLWMQHVRPLRAELKTPGAVMAFVAEWIERCRQRVVPTAKDKTLYNVDTAARNARYWLALAKTEPARFDPMSLDLVVFGYLRALRSYGKNDGRGFPGIFQADVFNRRALIAIGKGHHNGAASPSVVYAVR